MLRSDIWNVQESNRRHKMVAKQTIVPWRQASKTRNASRIKYQHPGEIKGGDTVKNLLPFRGSSRGSKGFLMDVMESWPRSECNYHFDTWSSRQRWSSPTSLRTPVLHVTNIGWWRPKAMSQAAPPSITAQKDLEGACSQPEIPGLYVGGWSSARDLRGEDTCWPDRYVYCGWRGRELKIVQENQNTAHGRPPKK